MNDHAGVSDPYEVVLADLRTQRAQIDQAIDLLTRLRGAADALLSPAQMMGQERGGEDPRSIFLGMSIGDATKKLLSLRKRKMTTTEITAELQAGGVMLSGAEPVNAVGSVLTRRFNAGDDVVRVDRGVWGLKEWYPNRSFKPAPRQPSSLEEIIAESAKILISDESASPAENPTPPPEQTRKWTYQARLMDSPPKGSDLDDDIPF